MTDIAALKKTFRIQRLIAIASAIVLFALLALYLLWTPITGPWSQERQGMAALRQAEQDRQITIEVARGELLAAQATADAARTMGQAARDFPEYRQMLYVKAFAEALADGSIKEVIYVPMETGLPLTEAGARAARN